MTFDAALAIRVGSASLFVLLGAFVVWVGRRSRGAALFGAMLGVYGLQVVSNNLARFFHVGLYVERGASAILAALVAVAASFMLPGVRRTPKSAAALGVAVAFSVEGLMLIGHDLSRFDALLDYASAPANLLPFLHIAGPSVTLATNVFTVSVSAAVALAPPTSRKGWRNAAALACVVGIWGTVQTATLTQEPFALTSFLAELLLVATLSGAWLVAAHRSGNRLALRMALLWPAVGVLAYAYLLVPGSSAAMYYDPWGLLGVARLVGWAILVQAIVRDDLLGVPLPRVVVRRGAVAGAALAALFIVAQVAQNFFSAEYGLLSGGILAGAFMFSASPIQRAMERLGEGKSPARSSARTGPRAEESYRAALRFALRDRRLTADEERSLVILAHELGIPPPRAYELRDEVAGAVA